MIDYKSGCLWEVYIYIYGVPFGNYATSPFFGKFHTMVLIDFGISESTSQEVRIEAFKELALQRRIYVLVPMFFNREYVSLLFNKLNFAIYHEV